MNETAAKEQTDVHVEEAPTPNLPAVHQERRPRTPAQRKPMPYAASIAKAVLSVSREVGTIQREGFNSFQKYKYTRWEDINERLSPLLQKHGLIIVQSEINRSLLEENEQGSVLAIVYHFTLVNGETGEQWPPIEWTGIARLRDAKGVSDDKAATKCHTQAEKFFCVKQFKIVTDDMSAEDRHASLPKKDAKDIYTKLQAEIDGQTSLVELGIWGNHNSDRIKSLPPDWQGILRERYAEKKADIENQQREMIDPETGELKPEYQ
jgi:hypothetical protein